MNLLQMRTEVLNMGFDPVRMTGRIDAWLNNAQFEVARRVNYYAEEAQQTLQTVAGTSLIAFPADLARVRTLRDTDTSISIENVGLADIDASNANRGRPRFWALDGANLHLYPTPDAVYNLALRYWKLPSILVADGDVPSLPQDYHNMLIDYATGRAYLAEDDLQTGEQYLQLFEKQLGQFHTDVVFPTSDEPHQVRGMWDEPRQLPGGTVWMI